MFKVGMGCLPKIPESLNREGQDFLEHCLQSKPDDRWTASQLKGHLFISVSTLLQGVSETACGFIFVYNWADFYSAATLLAVQSAVLATASQSVSK